MRRQSGTHANHICTRRPVHRRQSRTILHPHAHRWPIAPNNRGIHRRLPRGVAGRTAFHTQRRPIRTRTARKETRRPNQRVHPPANRHAEHTQRRNSARLRRSAQRRNRRRRPRLLRTARIRAGRRRAQRALAQLRKNGSTDDPPIRSNPTYQHRIDHQREPRRLPQLRRIRTGGIRPRIHRRAMPAPKPPGNLPCGKRTRHAMQLHGIPRRMQRHYPRHQRQSEPRTNHPHPHPRLIVLLHHRRQAQKHRRDQTHSARAPPISNLRGTANRHRATTRHQTIRRLHPGDRRKPRRSSNDHGVLA